MDFEYKDNCIPIMADTLSLNRYDQRFLNNIIDKYIQQNRGLTKKQDEVVNVILQKYRKQVKTKMNLYYQSLIDLPWLIPLVTAEKKKKHTYLKVENDFMLLAFPFNKEQIKEVRAMIHDDGHNHLNKFCTGGINTSKYSFFWNKTAMQWQGKFDPYLFKELKFDHYLFKELLQFENDKNVKILPSASEIEQAVNQYTKQQWMTQFIELHDRLYINCIDESMMPYLENMDTSDLSLNNIETYSVMLGIEPPDKYNKYLKELIMANSLSMDSYKIPDTITKLSDSVDYESSLYTTDTSSNIEKVINSKSLGVPLISLVIKYNSEIKDTTEFDTILSFVNQKHLAANLSTLENKKVIRLETIE